MSNVKNGKRPTMKFSNQNFEQIFFIGDDILKSKYSNYIYFLLQRWYILLIFNFFNIIKLFI